MTREIKFKYWDTDKMKMLHTAKEANASITEYDDDRKIKWLQYTGLKDVNGKEIYELMELNNKWKVSYKTPKYILIDISTGDIIDFNEQNKYEITREYTDIPKDPKGSVD